MNFTHRFRIENMSVLKIGASARKKKWNNGAHHQLLNGCSGEKQCKTEKINQKTGKTTIRQHEFK